MKKSNELLNGFMAFVIVASSLAVALFLNVPGQIENYYKESFEPVQNGEQAKDETADEIIDKRILLTLENISQYNNPSNPNCSEKFNQDPPNTIIKYEDKEKGISFDMPYNSDWGNEKYKINPYEKWKDESGKDYILFGSITDFEACSWVQSYALVFNPVKSADMLIKEMEEIPYYPEIFIIKPTKKSINGLDIVESQSHGMCDSGELEVVGKKYNYVLRPLCGADFEFLESIVKSIKLIE